MQKNLKKMRCKACEGLQDKLSLKKIKENLKQIRHWKLISNYIQKTYKFRDFKSALDFVNKIGKIAEQEDHHPNISFAWGIVEVTLYTHALRGLSMNDFILAAKIDEIKK